MTAEQIYALAVAAGFSPKIEVMPGVSLPCCMTAIALRESNGQPEVHNGDAKTGDNSWGLWQVNLLDPGIRAFLAAHGITSGQQLLDPATNAKAAHLLWGGRNANLTLAWYVYHDPPKQPYQQMYESHLPAALAAEAVDRGHV